MSLRRLLAVGVLIAVASVGSAVVVARAAGFQAQLVAPPFARVVSCPVAGEQPEGTVPCS